MIRIYQKEKYEDEKAKMICLVEKCKDVDETMT